MDHVNQNIEQVGPQGESCPPRDQIGGRGEGCGVPFVPEMIQPQPGDRIVCPQGYCGLNMIVSPNGNFPKHSRERSSPSGDRDLEPGRFHGTVVCERSQTKVPELQSVFVIRRGTYR